ncbi:MAG TPA: deoxyribodipyrimidine photo-lyase [Bacteroidales bacterium]|nr:deoxyribodipyrimidine photo-lyase [Bacteroidales bacterium]HRZ48400.1 deoxyribodipyrimidine photo-lyase [Bacteroidales bacterium]
MHPEPITLLWFRRDLRLHDNRALEAALAAGRDVLPLFIFDRHILDPLDRDDARVSFIHLTLHGMHRQLCDHGSGLLVCTGTPAEVLQRLVQQYNIGTVFAGEDYEPYGIRRDHKVKELLAGSGISLQLIKDHLIFRPGEVLKDDGQPYTVYTPFMRKWKTLFHKEMAEPIPPAVHAGKWHRHDPEFPSLRQIGFSSAEITVPDWDLSEATLRNYLHTRDLPAQDGTSHAGPHLRFGNLSVREAVRAALKHSETFLNELIWREFFAHILWYFPEVVHRSFKSAFEFFPWENDPEKISRWMNGTTGFPLVDAGMRQLVRTGTMHNRVRMVTASFLVKDLLVDWRIGEAFFARHLLDFELASNNGNWQWAAGTGCDAAPFFRIFNPSEQQRKFDPEMGYIQHWVPEYGTSAYPRPMVDHTEARKHAMQILKSLRDA